MRLSLLIVALRNGALLEPHPLQTRGFAETLRCVLGDFELPVQRPQLDVTSRGRGHHSQHDGPLPLLACEEARARRFGRAAQFAPHVELETGREIDRVVVDDAAAGQGRVRAGALARRGDAAVDLGKLRRAYDAVLRDRLIHMGGRNLEVLVVRERGSHKVRQDGILKLIPPGDVRYCVRFGGTEAPARWYVDVGAPVVGTDHAGG